MEQRVNTKYKPLFQTNARYIILMGGRGAGRSTVASQYANAKLMAEEYFRCAIMRYVLGDIRNSIYQEIIDRAEENNVVNELGVDKTMMTIKYGGNSINAVGFRKSSSDQKAKLKSLANYNCIIIEEADEVSEADFMQLDDSIRTIKGEIFIILLLNPPPKTHWIIQRWFDLDPSEQVGFYFPKLKSSIDDTLFIRTSFRDNLQNLSPQTVKNYERYRETKPDHYYNLIEGLVPEVVRGKIYSGWRIVDEVPFEARLERYGLDFGYSNDPTSIVAVYYHNGGYILDEIIYQPELHNAQIATILKNQQQKGIVIADAAEPKSIDEIRGLGVTILPAKKGQGSVSQGIQYVQSKKISVTRRSTNILIEYENYAWLEDKEVGDMLNEPKPGYDHAMDAIRYAFGSITDPDRATAHQSNPSSMTPKTGGQRLINVINKTAHQSAPRPFYGRGRMGR